MREEYPRHHQENCDVVSIEKRYKHGKKIDQNGRTTQFRGRADPTIILSGYGPG